MVEFTAEEFSTLMATNFVSVFHLCQLAYPLLKTSGAGSVVFVSSVSGFVGLKSMSVQGATKGDLLIRFWFCVADVKARNLILFMFSLFQGAINQLTRNLACEWAKDNIRSNAVAPWYIRTSIVEKVSPAFTLYWLFSSLYFSFFFLFSLKPLIKILASYRA